MTGRRVLPSLAALAAVLAACFAALVWNGRRAERTVAENLPPPNLSSGLREVDLWHPTASPGHVYDLRFVWPEDRPWTVPEGSRLQIQLASGGRTRLLVVRPGHPNEGVSWADVLFRRVRLQIVGDREWVDLGPLPESGTQRDVQVFGLLPGAFGFAVNASPSTTHFSGFSIRRPDSPLARPARTILRYRIRVAEPVPAAEALARFFFFVAQSAVLETAALLALSLLACGSWWLWSGRYTRAAAALVPAVTLLHACCLPPFQGADELAHEATVEAVLWNPAIFDEPPALPRSLVRVSDATGYEAFVGHPDVPVPIDTPARRAEAAHVLRDPLAADARASAPPVGGGQVLDPGKRASLYYGAFRLLGPLLRPLGVLDRISAYVVLSALASLGFFLAGLLLLRRFGTDPSLHLAFALVALVPYSVGVVASCSNYSLAIGIGQFLAACLVGGVLSAAPRERLLAAALFAGVSLCGIGVWDDFVFFALPGTVVFSVLLARAALGLPPGSRRRVVTAVLLAAAVLLVAIVSFAVGTGRIRSVVSSFGARLPGLGGFEDPSLWLLLGAASVPFVTSLVLALAIVRSTGMPERSLRLAAAARSATLVALFGVLFAVTPWRAIPFEFLRLDYPDEVAAHWVAFWSNNFAFDQDVLSWKMYWGVFGYADVSYPDAIYALARWLCVGLVLALPLLSWRFTRKEPVRSALLVVAAGYALTACVVTNSLRYFVPTNPWGRFILPILPLAALPLFARVATAERARRLRLAAAALVALHLWTAIVLLGSRYALGR